jgi:hypothetical protein
MVRESVDPEKGRTMTRMSILFAMVFCFVAAPLMAADTNVTGKWEITTSSPRGERTSSIEFIQSGQELKVVTEGRDGGKVEGTGTITGDKIAWSITRETQRGTFMMTYHGTVAETSMEGDVEFGTMGSGKWTATKQGQ